jgi:PAS domain S-box-containing protein
MKLRTSLLVLAAGTLLPMVVLAVVASVLLLRNEQESVQQNAANVVRGILTAVDAKLAASIGTLETLAASRALDGGDLGVIYEDLARALPSQPEWITLVLIATSGQQVINLLRPLDAELPKIGERRGFEQVLRTGKPAVSDMFSGPMSKQDGFAIRVPVVRDGIIKYVLTAVIHPDSVASLLNDGRRPDQWLAVIVDGNNRIVARTNSQENFGHAAEEAMSRAITRAPSGAFHGATQEGTPVYAPYERSSFSGWSVVLGIPEAVLSAERSRTVWIMIAAVVTAALAGIFLALILGRRIAGPITALASSARALGRGERVHIPTRTAINEVRLLSGALQNAAEAVHEREQTQGHLAALVQASNDSIVSFTVDGLILTWNPAATQLFGYTAEESVGRHVSFLAPPDTRPEQASVFHAAARGEFIRHETERVTKDGRRIIIDLAVYPIRNSAGKVTGISGLARDITDRKRAENAMRESEQRFVLLAESLPQIVWVASADGRTEYVNRRWSEYSGMDLEDTQGRGWVVGLHPDDREDFQAHWNSALVTGEPLEVEVRLRRADGAYQWFLARGVPVRGADGRILRWFGTDTNIDNQKRAEAELRASDRAKDEFLAMLGHELRNPLGAIAGAVGILNILAKPEDAKADRARAVIGRQVQHLTHLVDDLLDVSRVTTGKVVLHKRAIDLSELAESCMNGWRAAGRFDRHDVTADAVPVWVDGDETRLEQILSNLVGNAIKYTPDGGRVRIEVAPEGDMAMIRIADTGIGIPPELIEKVFDLFVQGDRQAPERSKAGLGIGLTVVKGLVTLHSGSVEVRSDGPGQGTVVTVRLPRIPTPQTLIKANRDRKQTRISRRILLIEDNPDARDMLKDGLSLEGHVVHEAANGRTGIAMAAQLNPEVVLVDVGLPDVEGYEVAQRVRAMKGKSVLLIATTGYGQPEDRRRALEAGFDAHITKPVSPEQVAALIEACLAEAQTSDSDDDRP